MGFMNPFATGPADQLRAAQDYNQMALAQQLAMYEYSIKNSEAAMEFNRQQEERRWRDVVQMKLLRSPLNSLLARKIFRRSTSGASLRDNRTLAATVEEGTAPKRMIGKCANPTQ